MSAEDRAALPLPPELFDALIRVIRETVRAEMRAEFEGRKPGVVDPKVEEEIARQMDELCGPTAYQRNNSGNRDLAMVEAVAAKRKGPNGGRSALQQSQAYDVPETVAGVPV